MGLDPWDGINPPPCPLRMPEPSSIFSRACIECGKIHDTGWQDTETGAMIERIDRCYDCFMKSLFDKCQAHWTTANIDRPVKLRDNVEENV